MTSKREPNSQKRTTLNDVAKKAGVDTSVVSRVRNEDPALNIRDETRERVVQAMRDLGYRPNVAARTLRTAKTGTIGLYIPDFANFIYLEIIRAVEAAASELGYILMTGSTGSSASNAEVYLDVLGQGRVDALLLAGDTVDKNSHPTLDEFGLPYLLLNRRMSGSTRYVILDDEKAAGIAVDHAVSLGHTRIAHLAGERNTDTARRRIAGFSAAMKAHSLAPDPRLIVDAHYSLEGGFQAMHQLMALPSPPTFVVAADQASAIGALSAARDLGVTIPHDVSLVAISDSAMSNFQQPRISSVKMPLAAMGRRAVELLIERGANERITEMISSDIELVLRESTSVVPFR